MACVDRFVILSGTNVAPRPSSTTSRMDPMTLMQEPVLQTSLSNLPVRRGKVRDIYDLGDELLLVSTDRISAFDWVLPTGIPDKGRVLTQISAFWFGRLGEAESHALDQYRRGRPAARLSIARRWPAAACWCARPKSCPSSAWFAGTCRARAGRNTASAAASAASHCPRGSKKAIGCPSRSSPPPPRKKAATTKTSRSSEWSSWSDATYPRSCAAAAWASTSAAPSYARARGIIIADTKFEWGRIGEEIILIDEVLTPDSSRFWPLDAYAPGRSQAIVRQAVRARLAGDDGLGQEQPAPRVARRRRDQNPRQVHRRLRATDRPSLRLEVTSASCPRRDSRLGGPDNLLRLSGNCRILTRSASEGRLDEEPSLARRVSVGTAACGVFRA